MLRKMAKKIKFHIFRFRPTFSILSRKVVSLQKCKKHLCCNLFWVLQKYLYFDWAIGCGHKCRYLHHYLGQIYA